MPMDFQGEMDRMRRELAEQTAALTKMQKDMAEVTGEATSADGGITARVGAAGELTDLKLHADKHRSMTGLALGAAIVEIVTKARADAQRQVAELMPESPFEGVGFAEMSEPGFDWTSLLPTEVPDVPPLPSRGIHDQSRRSHR